jgi:hypothetical protein
VLLSQGAVTSLLLGQNLISRSNDESSELNGFKTRLPFEIKLRSSPVNRFEVARNEYFSSSSLQEVMIKLEDSIRDTVVNLFQQELERERDELKRRESEYAVLEKELAAHALDIQQTRHNIEKVKDVSLPIPRSGEFLFQELGSDTVHRGRVELSNAEEKQTVSKRIMEMIMKGDKATSWLQQDEVLTIDVSDPQSTTEWGQKGVYTFGLMSQDSHNIDGILSLT